MGGLRVSQVRNMLIVLLSIGSPAFAKPLTIDDLTMSPDTNLQQSTRGETLSATVAFNAQTPDAQVGQFLRNLGGNGPIANDAIKPEYVAGLIDLARMAEWVADQRFKMLDDAQQAQFKTKLSGLLAEGLQTVLAGKTAIVLPAVVGHVPGEAFVPLNLAERHDRTALVVVYHWIAGQGWRGVDVLSNGVSAAASFKSYFADSLTR